MAVMLAVAGLGGAGSASGASGKELFLKNCAPCHGPDGSARSPAARKLGVRDLRPSTLSDEKIAQQIRNGVQDAGGKAKMPAFEDKFSADEIEALVRVVKALRSPSPAPDAGKKDRPAAAP